MRPLASNVHKVTRIVQRLLILLNDADTLLQTVAARVRMDCRGQHCNLKWP